MLDSKGRMSLVRRRLWPPSLKRWKPSHPLVHAAKSAFAMTANAMPTSASAIRVATALALLIAVQAAASSADQVA